MLAYRIAKSAYANDLSGEGARLYGGRWNPKGFAVLYTSAHRSLAALEILAHTSAPAIPEDLMMISIWIPNDCSSESITPEDLPGDWRNYPAPISLANRGKRWLVEGSALVLTVPSVIIPSETNILINPAHPEFYQVEIREILPFRIDDRLKNNHKRN